MNAERSARFWRDGAVRHKRGMIDQAFDPA